MNNYEKIYRPPKDSLKSLKVLNLIDMDLNWK